MLAVVLEWIMGTREGLGCSDSHMGETVTVMKKERKEGTGVY